MFAHVVVICNRNLKGIKYNFSRVRTNQLYSGNEVRCFHVADKVKGTFLENWLNYWKNVYIDYKEVAINISKDSRAHPFKTVIYALCVSTAYYFAKHNPNEIDFREQLISSSLKLVQINESIKNPVSACYVKWVEQCYNEGILCRLNFGIVSVMWINNYDKHCTLYKTVCPYLKPQYLGFHQRIIDIGFLDNWWILKNSMIDYDVNDGEYLQDIVSSK